jgi:hypothetical protein
MIDHHPPTAASRIADAVGDYRSNPDLPRLLSRLRSVAADTTPEDLAAAVEPFRDIPEVAGPVYETIVAKRPDDARALVILANAYWLSGRGPDVVGQLASRAIAADTSNRGAWHLWALTAERPRERMNRWEQVTQRFPEDDLAKAALGDIAASVGADDDDPAAKQLAIATFVDLEARAKTQQQKIAIGHALAALRGETSA